jgi:TetR/AcrR family tetracycline transcriptional repressor
MQRRDDKWFRDVKRIDQAQRRAQERMEHEQAKINQRFEKMREQVDKRHGQPSDTQQRIIEAALVLLEEDGLNNLSLRKLATKLDMKAPALYWHFNSKDVLIDHMAEAILAKSFHDLQPRNENQSWQDWLQENMMKLRRAMLAYPDGARVVAGAHLQPAVTLAKLFEYCLISVNSSGKSLKEARYVLMTATTYTFGFVIEEQSSPSDEEIGAMRLEDMELRFPNIVKATKEAHVSFRDLDKDYKIGLDYIIKGASS